MYICWAPTHLSKFTCVMHTHTHNVYMHAYYNTKSHFAEGLYWMCNMSASGQFMYARHACMQTAIDTIPSKPQGYVAPLDQEHRPADADRDAGALQWAGTGNRGLSSVWQGLCCLRFNL